MYNLRSFGDRLGVSLESLWGSFLEPLGTFFGPSWRSNNLLSVLCLKECLFTKQYALPGLKLFLPNMATPKQPNIATRRLRGRLGRFFLLLPFFQQRSDLGLLFYRRFDPGRNNRDTHTHPCHQKKYYYCCFSNGVC